MVKKVNKQRVQRVPNKMLEDLDMSKFTISRKAIEKSELSMNLMEEIQMEEEIDLHELDNEYSSGMSQGAGEALEDMIR